MCKLMLGIATTPEGQKTMRDIMALYRRAMKEEKDGIALAWQEADGIKSLRRLSLSAYDEVMDKIRDLKSNFIALHSRTATIGALSLDNVHFFDNGYWTMAHNGTLSALRGGSEGTTTGAYPAHSPYCVCLLCAAKKKAPPENELSDIQLANAETFDCDGCLNAKRGVCKRHKDDARALTLDDLDTYNGSSLGFSASRTGKSDSLRFLETLPQDLTPKDLEKKADAASFWGIAILASLDGKRKILINKKEQARIHIGDGFTIVYSFEPSKKATIQKWGYAHGLPYLSENEEPIPGRVFPLAGGAYEITANP